MTSGRNLDLQVLLCEIYTRAVVAKDVYVNVGQQDLSTLT